MTVYVESNFLLELAFEQEQANDCLGLLDLAQSGKVTLLVPAYCVGESLEKIGRRKQQRRSIQEAINSEVKELSRSSSAASVCEQLKRMATALMENTKIDEERFEALLLKLHDCAQFVPMHGTINRKSLEVRRKYDLPPQDAIVYASVLDHLESSNAAKAVFVNRNSREFDTREIATDLQQLNCSYKPSFAAGLAYIRAELGRVAEIDHP